MMLKCAYNASYYDADVPTEWHVLDRDSGKKVAHFDAANVEWIGRQLTGQTYFRGEGVPGSIFHTHTVNSFEGADGSITMDFIGWPDMAIFYGIGLELMLDNPRDYQETWEPARLTRCIINGTAATTCEILVDQNFGLPNFNVERFQGKAYNFVYGTGITDKATSDFVDRLLKVDIAQRKISHVWSEPDCFVTEPVFVARPEGEAEDDGVLLSTIYDASKDSSFLLLLNAQDFSELARIDIEGKIQAHYHGRFCKHYGDRTCVGS
jgi:carotenoid cleavage dioxygenase-like enzyme